MSELLSLGYIGIRARDVDEWADYGTKFLGMQLVDRSQLLAVGLAHAARHAAVRRK